MKEQIRAFLVFLGISNAIDYNEETNKANLELAEDELGRSAELFHELKNNNASLKEELAKVSADLKETAEQLFTAKTELDKTNADFVEVSEKVEELEKENAELRASDGATPLIPKKKNDMNVKQKIVVSRSKSWKENQNSVKEKYFKKR